MSAANENKRSVRILDDHTVLVEDVDFQADDNIIKYVICAGFNSWNGFDDV